MNEEAFEIYCEGLGITDDPTPEQQADFDKYFWYQPNRLDETWKWFWEMKVKATKVQRRVERDIEYLAGWGFYRSPSWRECSIRCGEAFGWSFCPPSPEEDVPLGSPCPGCGKGVVMFRWPYTVDERDEAIGLKQLGINNPRQDDWRWA